MDEKTTQTRWSSDQESLENLHKIIRSIQFYGTECRKEVNILILKYWISKLLTAWTTVIILKATTEEKTKVKNHCKKYSQVGKLTKIVGQPGQQQAVIDTKAYYRYVDLTSVLQQLIFQIANDHNMLMGDRKHEEYEPEWW